MKRHLKIYVKETLFNGQEQPNRNNRRYFPRMKTIRNHMYNATVRSRLSALDQDNVKLLIDNWTKENPEDNFFYRPYMESESGDLLSMCTGSDKNSSNNELEELEECDDEVIITKAGKQEDRLLFVHQTVWQSRLLLKYGQDLINSFFWCLQGKYQNITYASSTSMLALQKQSPSELLWKHIDISTKKYIFAPWNPTDHHWTLVVVDIQQQKIIYLDPFQMEVNSGYLKLLAAFMPEVLFRKFGFSGFQLESPPHTLQTDHKSCGVLVCWYALQILQGKPITDYCNEYAIRAAIYDEIRGNCMKRRSGLPYVELQKCTECKLPVDDDKIECGRCFQQYHLGCIKQATGTVTDVNFYCPPY